jgi:hypothetical protein
MDDAESPVSVLAWRVTELERGRVRLLEKLERDYLTGPEMRNQFVTHEEMQARAKMRREWPMMIAAVMSTVTGCTTLVLLIAGAH